MHTVKVVGAGFGLLALCVLVGRVIDGKKGVATGASAFLPLWLAGSGLNMYFGVRNAGYAIREELPVGACVFSAPALVAIGLRLQLK